MRLRFLRDSVLLGEWCLAGTIHEVPVEMAHRFLASEAAELLPGEPETASLTPSGTAARTKRGKGRKRA
jgi:hypothetical protein